MSQWNAMTYEGKDTILRVVRNEADEMFALAGAPGAWDAPTACESWKVRDVVGHIVDTTEGYFRAFDTARAGAEAPAPHGLVVMHELAGRGGQELGAESQQELLSRARADLDKMMGILEPLTADEWTGLMVPHAYMGPVPAFVYAGGQLMDYGVHTWDIRQGSGHAHALSADAADLLVPFMFIIWQSTIRPDADLTPFSIGIRVSGRNAGDTRVSIGEGGMSYEPGRIDDLPAILEFDPGSMVLTAFGRINGGTASGDVALANRFLNLFFRI
ncbi:MAG TPA: maleylpyruvate isomerase family mycothiol-dependent enzyme [Streptosporangiaceae bacterium]|nr:maleylpyruvate isomerase family mycothiol-dependent enzyme [Streptosporangiaceae bacterium]